MDGKKTPPVWSVPEVKPKTRSSPAARSPSHDSAPGGIALDPHPRVSFSFGAALAVAGRAGYRWPGTEPALAAGALAVAGRRLAAGLLIGGGALDNFLLDAERTVALAVLIRYYL